MAALGGGEGGSGAKEGRRQDAKYFRRNSQFFTIFAYYTDAS